RGIGKVPDAKTPAAARAGTEAAGPRPGRDESERLPSVHAGRAFEEQGLADRRLYGALLERLGDEEGRLRPLPRQQAVGIGGDEDRRHLEVVEDVGDGIDARRAVGELNIG